jgi:hypothetical protein
MPALPCLHKRHRSETVFTSSGNWNWGACGLADAGNAGGDAVETWITASCSPTVVEDAVGAAAAAAGDSTCAGIVTRPAAVGRPRFGISICCEIVLRPGLILMV